MADHKNSFFRVSEAEQGINERAVFRAHDCAMLTVVKAPARNNNGVDSLRQRRDLIPQPFQGVSFSGVLPEIFRPPGLLTKAGAVVVFQITAGEPGAEHLLLLPENPQAFCGNPAVCLLHLAELCMGQPQQLFQAQLLINGIGAV